jgi:beta-galactosidase
MATFTYRDGRFFKDGAPFYFLGAEYQYYRDKRSNWAARLDQLKAGNVNVICFYIPWRHHIVHDPVTGAVSYDFDGRTFDSRDLRTFLKLCQERGLQMLAKPGPFVHSELNIGGLPDISSPTFNPGIEPVRLQNGDPLFWEYDHTQMPSPNDATFDALAKRWLSEVGKVLAPYVAPKGNWSGPESTPAAARKIASAIPLPPPACSGQIIAIQLLDETIYCTSNDAPWHFGYDAPDQRHFQAMLAAKYGTVVEYNRVHGTAVKAFQFVVPPRLDPTKPVALNRGDVLGLIDWGEFQWRIRREFYARYKEYLGIDLPYLTNYAGITPPIDENVPDKVEESVKDTPREYLPLYPEWWLSQNRVDQDLDVYEYGMISWLGVASYNVPDASTPPKDDVGANEVFNRYINTSRRRRGINIEENWGFATLYHPLSKYPMIPFFQTLACVAGGCTGYVVFTGVSHGYWLDDLDRTTQKQHRTFPSDAPIGENGEIGPMYKAMKDLNEWFAKEGADFLKAELDMDVCLLAVPEYAAVSSWVPEGKAPHWVLPHAVPRTGYDVIEPATMTCNAQGVNYEIAELPALSADDLLQKPRAAVHLSFFLGRREQQTLVDFVKRGGTLIASGELPAYDEKMDPCTVLGDFVRAYGDGKSKAKGTLLYSTGNVFNDPRAFLGNLRLAGWQKKVGYGDGLRAFVYRHEDDFYIFFFNFDRHGQHDKTIEFYGRRLGLTVGSKTCGVVHVKGASAVAGKGKDKEAGHDRIVSYLVKGENEFEVETTDVRLRLGKQEIRFTGDSSKYDI